MDSIKRILIFAVVGLGGCALRQPAQVDRAAEAKARLAAPGDEGGPAALPRPITVRAIDVIEKSDTTVITIDANANPADNYQVFKMNEPLRLVVDIVNSTSELSATPIQVGNGTVGEIKAAFYPDHGNNVTRVMIAFVKPVEPTVTLDGNSIIVEVEREQALNEEPPAREEAPPAVGVNDSAPETPVVRGDVDLPVVAAAPIDIPEAPIFDEGNVGQSDLAVAEPAPEALAPEPEPIEEAPLPDAETFAAAEEVREVQPADDLDSDGGDPEGIAALNEIDAAEEVAPIAIDETPTVAVAEVMAEESAPEPEPIEDAPVDVFASQGELAPIEDAPVDFGPAANDRAMAVTSLDEPEAPAAILPEPEALPEPEPVEVAVAQPVEEIPNFPEGGGEGARVRGLDFLNLADVSRIQIQLSAQVAYETSESGSDTVVLELSGARLPSSLQRAWDTSEFESALKMVSFYQNGDNVRIVSRMRERVAFRVSPQGTTLLLDFDRPAELKSGPQVAAVMAPAALDGGASADPEADADAAQVSADVAPTPVGPKIFAEADSKFGQPAEMVFSDPSFAELTGGRTFTGDVDQPSFAGIATGAVFEDPTARRVYSGRKINMDFQDAAIPAVLRLIAEVSKLNIITSDEAGKGTVTVRLIDVPWDMALDIVLKTKGLGMERFGNVIRIDTLKNLQEEREAKKKALDAAKEIEPIETLILPVSYATAAEVKDRLASFLSKEGKIQVDDRTNSLIIDDHPSNLSKLRNLTKTLDTQTPQVLIEARLVEARTSFTQDFGIQWGGTFNPNPTGIFFPNTFGMRGGTGGINTTSVGPAASDSLVVDLPGPSQTGIGLFFGSLGDIVSIDARLNALETNNEIRVVSSPRVATLDNKKATIRQGARIPFLSTSQSGTKTDFVDAALDLEVTPHITADKSIFLQIKVKNNRPGANVNVGTGGSAPAIDIAEAETEVLVKDGDTTVIGGVYIINNSKSEAGLPVLKDLPFVGWLFHNKGINEDRRELLVFLTPRILTRSQASN